MNEDSIQRIENSFHALAPRGEELMGRFYAHLFARFPDVRPMFPREMSAQKKMLLASLVLVVKNLRKPDAVRKALLVLGERHESYGAQPAHYVAVRDTMLNVMAEIAAGAWSAQLHQDWKATLDDAAEVMLEGQKQAQAAAQT